jgi:Bacterial Ig-like domain
MALYDGRGTGHEPSRRNTYRACHHKLWFDRWRTDEHGVAVFSEDLAPETITAISFTVTCVAPAASNYVWTFTTGLAPDTTPPTVNSTSPLANATGVAINTLVAASFSEQMDPLTATASSLTLACATGAPIAGGCHPSIVLEALYQQSRRANLEEWNSQTPELDTGEPGDSQSLAGASVAGPQTNLRDNYLFTHRRNELAPM